MSSDQDKADILRIRWRSQLFVLNEDQAGADLCNNLADVMDRYHEARDVALALKTKMKRSGAIDRLRNLGVDIPQELLDAVEAAGGTVSEADYYGSVEQLNYSMYRGQLVQLRRFWRAIRDLQQGAPGWVPPHAIDNFSEPSDEELLAGQDGDA